MVKHITLGDKTYGFATEPIREFVSFLDIFSKSVEEVKALPPTFVLTPDGFEKVNKLQDDITVLTSYTNEENHRTVDLLNLRTDEVLHSWEIKNPYQEHDRIMDPLLFPDKSLCYSFNGVSGFTKIDSMGRIIWEQNEIVHHHSANLDAEGNIWACSYAKDSAKYILYKGLFNLEGMEFHVIDNSISKVNAETGELIYQKSMVEILHENGLTYLLVNSPNREDAIHLNDIQPALKTTSFYEKGDLFLSSRNMSCILHFRPSNGKVLRLIQGPFSTQHDVDFLDDSTLVFFNNNSPVLWQNPAYNWSLSQETISFGRVCSNITGYSFAEDSLFTIGDSIFTANQIYTFTEGGQEFLENGSVFVEEQNGSFLWVLKDEEVIYCNVLQSQHEGYHHLTNWIRVINN